MNRIAGAGELCAHRCSSHSIVQVSFTLHSSFAKPLREYTEPPFEVREEGWGEFDVAIKVRCTSSEVCPAMHGAWGELNTASK